LILSYIFAKFESQLDHKTNDAAFSGIFGLMKPEKHTMLAQVEANQKWSAALLRTSFGLLD
jgi:hypothetical protein